MTDVLSTDRAGQSMQAVALDSEDFLIPIGIPGSTAQQAKDRFEYLPQFQLRKDDVMLVTYPKTGTNWVYEIIMMLLNQSAARVSSNKLATMLEFMTQQEVDAIPSPRVVNTHMAHRYWPLDLAKKRVRTVMVLRNPKDTAVSFYNHLAGMVQTGYQGAWADWLQLYLGEQPVFYGRYCEYLRQIEAAMAKGLDFPFHIVYYEDLKKNGLHEVLRLAEFLGVSADEALCSKIVKQCDFATMARDKVIIPEEMKPAALRPGFEFFRKGEVGDWRNWFTVAESEQFDSYWRREMAASNLTFTYTLDPSDETTASI